MAIQCICQKCGKNFSVMPSQKAQGWGKYCSTECRRLARLSRSTKIAVNCQHCGKEFETTTARTKRGWGKYCSSECQHLGARKRETATCLHCGQSFNVTPSELRQGNVKYCSRKCRYDYEAKHKEFSPCLNCGTMINIKPHMKTKGMGKYCSSKCFSEASVKRNSLTCEICGNTFQATPANIKKGTARFCSKTCAGKWRSANQQGENNAVWAGGTSLIEYPTEFSRKFKTMIMQRDGHVCAVCRLPRKLDVHHIDYNKKNTIPGNCISLCRNCHARCHSKSKLTRDRSRAYWQRILSQLVAAREYHEPECQGSLRAIGTCSVAKQTA